MNRFFYTAFLRLLAPGLMGWMALRARRAGGRWEVWSGARFGRYAAPDAGERPVWVHAVSLGETRAAQPLVQALLDQGDRVLLTHMTATGREEGGRLFADAIAQGRLRQEWLPYDFPGCAQRFVAHYRPLLGVLMEREIWPNLIAAAHRARAPMILASARFSDQALRQSLRAGRVMREAYGNLQAVYAQTLQDAQRLEQAGASAVRVSGNFKFDIALPADKVARGRAFGAALRRKLIAIASTREGEDEMFVRALLKYARRAAGRGRALRERVLFCLIPRHPQRFDAAADLLREAGIDCVRRSSLSGLDQAGAQELIEGRVATQAGAAGQDPARPGAPLVLLGDSLGEMPAYYAACDVAIVAGSFAPLGGQNLIEACSLGVPVLVGPHTRNFEQAVADAVEEGAALRVPDADAAVLKALQLLEHPKDLAGMGQAGVHWVQKHTGAVARVLAGLNELSDGMPRDA
ncbi:3-deoxy-D-manno-octulosonic acid transferase [Candidimonas nitroreducens]|uniref:3-deoxy-D-manno-octulosonic acid transferase n=1 Tax=Candidimonas nitroreducens TaxID=683354 RepID=A0A225M1A9_9BURK|nr:3-deoxy-D-manno-octulosonic acid transferase [Candidimonas nitroreducens]OWT53993.1 3-deoxy-D-manno-octulosonic acid transferase [Candidimonas nitroreducens]